MRDFIGKASLAIIFPFILFSAAIFPFNCNFSRDGGVFKSDNGGLGWQQKITIDKSNTIGTKDVLSMAIDRLNPNIIYIGTQGNGLWQSMDEAATWRQIIDKTSILDRAGDVSSIIIDPRREDSIYLAVYQSGFGRILYSGDQGVNWQQIYITSKNAIYVNAIDVDNTNTANIYAGISDGTLLKSPDFGSSWQTIKLFTPWSRSTRAVPISPLAPVTKTLIDRYLPDFFHTTRLDNMEIYQVSLVQ